MQLPKPSHHASGQHVARTLRWAVGAGRLGTSLSSQSCSVSSASLRRSKREGVALSRPAECRANRCAVCSFPERRRSRRKLIKAQRRNLDRLQVRSANIANLAAIEGLQPRDPARAKPSRDGLPDDDITDDTMLVARVPGGDRASFAVWSGQWAGSRASAARTCHTRSRSGRLRCRRRRVPGLFGQPRADRRLISSTLAAEIYVLQWGIGEAMKVRGATMSLQDRRSISKRESMRVAKLRIVWWVGLP